MNERQLPFSEMTLVVALATFRSENGLSEKYQGMSEEAQTHFERHDIIHVLFGLSTDIRQEAQADAWTLVGSDVRWSDLLAFMKLPEEQEILAEIGFWSACKAAFAALPDYAGILWRSRRMNKKWRWSDHAAYRNMPVGAIRREFGIDSALA